MSEMDKEPLWMFLASLLFLVPLASILFFLIRWLLSYTAQWELIVAIILTVVCGGLVLFALYVSIKILIELIEEVVLVVQIRKEEKELQEAEN